MVNTAYSNLQLDVRCTHLIEICTVQPQLIIVHAKIIHWRIVYLLPQPCTCKFTLRVFRKFGNSIDVGLGSTNCFSLCLLVVLCSCCENVEERVLLSTVMGTFRVELAHYLNSLII